MLCYPRVVDDGGGDGSSHAPVTIGVGGSSALLHITTEQVLTMDSVGSIWMTTFAVDGYLNDVGMVPFRFYNLSGASRTITRVKITVAEAPTGDSIIVDVLKNGTTIFTTPANRPEIAAAAFTAETTTIEVPTWAADEYLEVNVVQYGSVQPGRHLVVQIAHDGVATGGGGGSSHDPVTLAAAAAAVMSLSAQEIDLDAQAANAVLIGPNAGPPAKPTFRSLVSGDIPTLDHGAKLSGLGDDDHPQYHNDARADLWHDAIGDASPHHPQVTTGSNASDIVDIGASQILLFDRQAPHTFLAGPAFAGPNGDPGFRAIQAADLPLSTVDHGTLAGLGDDDHPQYAHLPGRAGGQTLYGGIAASEGLVLNSTSDVTQGTVDIQSTGGLTHVGGGLHVDDGLRLWNDAHFGGFKAIAMACDNGTSFPAAPTTGQWYYRTDVDVLYIYDGAWKPIIGFSALNLYVDGTLGSNGDGQGFSAGAGATATIAAALNLVPPIVPNGATINVAAGTYAGNFTVPRTVGTISIYGAYTEVASGTTTSTYCASSQTQTGTLSTVGTSAVVTVTGGAGTTNVYPGTIVFVTTNKALAGIVLTVDSATQFTLDRALDLSAGSYAWGVSGSAHVDSGAAWADDAHNGRLVVLSATGTPSIDAARAFPVYDTDSAKKSLFVVGVTSGFTVSGLAYSVRTLDTIITGQITINSAGVGGVVLRWLKYTRSSGTMITAQERSVDIRACELVSSGTSSVFQVRDTGRLTVQNCRVAGTTSLYGALIFAIGYMEMRYTEWSVYSTGAYASIWVYYSSGYADFVNGYLCGASTGAAFLLITTQSFWRAIGANTFVYMSGTSRAVQLRYGSQTLDVATTSAYIYGFSETIVPQTQTYGMSDAVVLVQNYPNTTAPSTTSDQSKVWAQDQDGVAGNSGLHVKSETGDITSIGNRISTTGGLVINSGGGSASTYDATIKSDNYDALFIDASNDSIALMNHASGKVGFYAATPIARPTTGSAAATFVQNSGNAVNDASTFDGYTLLQVVKALRDLGLLT